MLPQSRSSILPFKKTVTHARLECGALRFDFVDGKAVTEHGVVVRTDRLAIVGRGVVDLGEERLDMHFKPYVRQGIKLKTGGAQEANHLVTMFLDLVD